MSLKGVERGCHRSGKGVDPRELCKLWWLRIPAHGGAGPTGPPMASVPDALDRLRAASCLSTMTIMITPTFPSDPVSGVQCIQRAFPSIMSKSAVAMLAPSSMMGVSERVPTRVNQETLAVTPMPWASASMSESRMCSGPPMWSSSLD